MGRRGSTPPGHDCQAIRRRTVRGDIRAVGCLSPCRRLLAFSRRRGLGPLEPSGDQRELERRAGVRRLAVREDRKEVSPAHRGGMGVRRPRVDPDTVLPGRRARTRPGELRAMRGTLGRHEDRAARQLSTEWIRAVRHAGKRVGVGGRLRTPGLFGCAVGRKRVARTGRLSFAHVARWIMGRPREQDAQRNPVLGVRRDTKERKTRWPDGDRESRRTLGTRVDAADFRRRVGPRRTRPGRTGR